MIPSYSPRTRVLAVLPVVLVPWVVEWFVRRVPQTGWDWTEVLVTLFSLAQLPFLLVALAWAVGWARAPWANAALIGLALVGGGLGWLPSPVVWPTVLVNLPGVLIGVFARRP